MTPNIPGIESVVRWFGEWPSFHDAEITTLHLARRGSSSIRIHTWIRTDQVREDGVFVLEREAAVVFEFLGISWLRFEGEDADRQNVIAGLALEPVPGGHRLTLDPCYGLSGQIVAKEWNVKVEQLADYETIQSKSSSDRGPQETD